MASGRASKKEEFEEVGNEAAGEWGAMASVEEGFVVDVGVEGDIKAELVGEATGVGAKGEDVGEVEADVGLTEGRVVDCLEVAASEDVVNAVVSMMAAEWAGGGWFAKASVGGPLVKDSAEVGAGEARLVFVLLEFFVDACNVLDGVDDKVVGKEPAEAASEEGVSVIKGIGEANVFGDEGLGVGVIEDGLCWEADGVKVKYGVAHLVVASVVQPVDVGAL